MLDFVPLHLENEVQLDKPFAQLPTQPHAQQISEWLARERPTTGNDVRIVVCMAGAACIPYLRSKTDTLVE